MRSGAAVICALLALLALCKAQEQAAAAASAARAAGAAQIDATTEPQQQQEPPLLLPATGGEGSGEGGNSIRLGEKVALDTLGPTVVSEDGRISLISNWEQLSEVERQVAWRRITERNRRRLATIKQDFEAAGQQQPEGQAEGQQQQAPAPQAEQQEEQPAADEL
ncbi:MAG: hypothetical protein J3K34DRAFT_421141 [Monoraphidium minutum]|nr:MAG: hypothetical protein J3K34DRAFT_421141 [Monoraphidium minutum]